MDYLNNLEENDKEIIEGLVHLNDIINLGSDNPPRIYNPAQFQERFFINLLIKYKMMRNMSIYPKFGELMKIITHKAPINNLILR